jgi:hypothetical protein
MGFAKRARLNATLPDASELPPAADLSSIRIVRRDKGPAPVIALADSRPAGDDAAKPATDGLFYKKGNASAATFRPAYWTYEPSTPNAPGAVASLERQLDARRRSQPVAPAPLEEKPLASLGTAPASRKLAGPAEEDGAPVHGQLVPTPKPAAPAALDTRTVLELLQPNSGVAEAQGEPVLAEPVPARLPAAEAVSISSTNEVPPPATPAALIPQPTPDPPKKSPPVTASASAAVEIPATDLPPALAPADSSSPSVRATEPKEIHSETQIDGETHDERPAPPPRQRPAREAARRVNAENAEVLDSLGATIESVLASRWYGSDRPSSYSGRVLRADEIAPVTPSGLIAELATVQKQAAPATAAPHRRAGRIVAALCLVAIFAAAFFASLLWRSGHGLHLPMRVMPAIFGALSASEPEGKVADGEATGRRTTAAMFFVT